MTLIENPNWLTVIGLVYMVLGLIYLGLTQVTTARWQSGSQRLNRLSGQRNAIGASLGVVLVAAGLVIQIFAQFMVLPFNATAVLLLLGLIAIQAAFACADVDVIAHDEGSASTMGAGRAATSQRQAATVLPLHAEPAGQLAAG